MAIRYWDYYGHRVSRRWNVVLRAADRVGVRFHLDSGHRTMAEQQALYDQNMSGGHPKPGHPLTAVPSCDAPHIRCGHANHALDIDSTDGGTVRFANFLRHHGANPQWTVPNESWHIEITAKELARLSRKLRVVKPRTPAKKHVMRPWGIRFIAGFEGCRLRAYQDAVGVWTIGYGHTTNVHQGQVITKARAVQLLKQDVRDKAADAVRRLVKVPLTQNEFTALVSLVFNIGAGAFESSTLLRLLNGKHYFLASLQFLRWNRAGGQVLLGLSRRRRAERRLFRKR